MCLKLHYKRKLTTKSIECLIWQYVNIIIVLIRSKGESIMESVMVFAVETTISGFVSKAVNNCVDFSWSKIKKAVEKKDNKYQNLESHIYNVTVDVFNQITRNQYKNNQDKIYVAAEKLFMGYKNVRKDDIEVIRSSLETFYSSVDDDKCMEFKELLYRELSKDDNSSLYREIRLLQEVQESKKTSRIEQKVDQISQKINETKTNDEGIVITQNNGEKFKNNKKQKYIENWNSRLFLHKDNDKNPITLSCAFIAPRFDYYIEVGSIKFSDCDSLTEAIEKFIQYDKTSNLLITGSPGIGKTSIISWIADKYKDDEDILILRFRDWSNKDLTKGLFNAICNSLDCESVNLENKVIIIDGFDEIKSVNERKSLIQEFLNNTLDFDNLKVIITSRPDYLNTYDFQYAFKVLPFDISQIKEFYQIIKDEKLDQTKIDIENIDVLGIPVILYMAIMSDIDLTLKTTKPELYNKIFVEKGGIFDRFCFRGIGYDGGFQPLRDKNNVIIYLNFLRQVAFSMFEKNDLVLTEKEYNTPELMFQGEKLSVIEFPIKPFFECNGYNIEFIHKSIYEFFVAEYVFSSISEATVANVPIEELASVLGKIFNKNLLSQEIAEFLRFRINKSNEMYSKVYNAFEIMLQDGMSYYTGICYKNVMKCEKNIFMNMLIIIHLWENYSQEFGLSIIKYIKRSKDFGLDLTTLVDKKVVKGKIIQSEKSEKKMDLSHAELSYTDMRGKDLGNMDLSYADLSNTNLRDADLVKVNLNHANLTNAILTNAKLAFADLSNAILNNANLNYADLGYADLSNANLKDADLRDANLSNARFIDANLFYADLSNADMSKTDFTGADLRGTKLGCKSS